MEDTLLDLLTDFQLLVLQDLCFQARRKHFSQSIEMYKPVELKVENKELIQAKILEEGFDISNLGSVRIQYMLQQILCVATWDAETIVWIVHYVWIMSGLQTQ